MFSDEQTCSFLTDGQWPDGRGLNDDIIKGHIGSGDWTGDEDFQLSGTVVEGE